MHSVNGRTSKKKARKSDKKKFKGKYYYNITIDIRVFLIIRLKAIKSKEGIFCYLSSYLPYNFPFILTAIIMSLFFLDQV